MFLCYLFRRANGGSFGKQFVGNLLHRVTRKNIRSYNSLVIQVSVVIFHTYLYLWSFRYVFIKVSHLTSIRFVEGPLPEATVIESDCRIWSEIWLGIWSEIWLGIWSCNNVNLPSHQHHTDRQTGPLCPKGLVHYRDGLLRLGKNSYIRSEG